MPISAKAVNRKRKTPLKTSCNEATTFSALPLLTTTKYIKAGRVPLN